MLVDEKKKAAARAAIAYIEDEPVIGIGTGSTVNFFIEELAKSKGRIEGVVASSDASRALLQQHRIAIIPLNSMIEVPIYIDGADEATRHRSLLKGGGGALTREKIIAAASKQFICIVDDSKLVSQLGSFPLPLEVIPMAQSYVARRVAKLGGQPVLRDGVITDNGNIILDVHNLNIINPVELERQLDQIAGLVANGLFANRAADLLLVASDDGIEIIAHNS